MHGAGILYQSHRDGLFRQFFKEQESLFTTEVVERNGIDIVAPGRQENHQAFLDDLRYDADTASF